MITKITPCICKWTNTCLHNSYSKLKNYHRKYSEWICGWQLLWPPPFSFPSSIATPSMGKWRVDFHAHQCSQKISWISWHVLPALCLRSSIVCPFILIITGEKRKMNDSHALEEAKKPRVMGDIPMELIDEVMSTITDPAAMLGPEVSRVNQSSPATW